VLARQVEPNAARHQDLQRWGDGEQRVQVGRRREEVLEVVENEKGLSLIEVLDLPHVGRLRHGRENERRVPQRGERDEEDAVRVRIGELRGDLLSESRLAGSACPGDGNEASPASEQLA
jgi:hypothetical protein